MWVGVIFKNHGRKEVHKIVWNSKQQSSCKGRVYVDYNLHELWPWEHFFFVVSWLNCPNCREYITVFERVLFFLEIFSISPFFHYFQIQSGYEKPWWFTPRPLMYSNYRRCFLPHWKVYSQCMWFGSFRFPHLSCMSCILDHDAERKKIIAGWCWIHHIFWRMSCH